MEESFGLCKTTKMTSDMTHEAGVHGAQQVDKLGIRI